MSNPLAESACLLASSSPRRITLLQAVGCLVHVCPAHTEEIWPSLPPGPAAIEVAQAKLRASQQKFRAELDPEGKRLWLAADTVVVLDGVIFGKPKDDADAARMLRDLAGRTHEVITGFAASLGHRQTGGAVTTRVTMREYGEAELLAYVERGEARDKSGAYAIQSGGTALSARIEGSLSNIVGLPVAEVLAAAQALGWTP